MIHTYELRIELNEDQIENIMFHYDFKPINQVIETLEEQMKGIRLSQVTDDSHTFIRVHIDAVVALNTYVITEEHVVPLLAIHETICDYLLIDSLDALNQTRIDYRIDIKVEPIEHRELIMKLFHKTKHKYYRLEKGEKEHKSTVSLKNKSMEVKVYDKEKERKAKKQRIRDEEKNVLRFEVALRNRHLKYKKKKSGISKDLQTYLKEELHFRYMQKIVEVFFTGDFYYLSDAEAILEERKVPLSDRKHVRELMVLMSTEGYGGVKNAFSDFKIKKLLNILREANIHPVPIPKNEKMVGYSRETPVRNPVNEIAKAISNASKVTE